MLTKEERKSILDKDIPKREADGWRILHRSDLSCQLIKERQPNGCLLILLYMLFILPGIIYVTTYKGSKRLHIEVNEEGELKYYSDDPSFKR